jgi:DNA-binding XRE family transcriptional regulator
VGIPETEKGRFRGEKLQAAREALKRATGGKKGSQSWLAFTIGAHVTSISDWERGENEPSLRHAAAICAVPEFNLSIADLFGTEDAEDDDEEADPVADLMTAIRRVIREEVVRASEERG